MRTLPLLALLLACSGTGQPTVTDQPDGPGDTDLNVCSDESSLVAYERYIEPVMTDAHPQSCNQCHMSGVDLTMFVQDTPCSTMACMVEQGLVDFDDPQSSTVMGFIDQASPTSTLITEETITAEHDGMLAWIEYNASCFDEVCPDIADPCDQPAGTDLSDITTPLGGCDEATLVASFQHNVWHWNNRCISCHGAGGEGREENPTATLFYINDERDPYNSIMATMYSLIGIGAIDADNPANSRLITKPLAEDLAAVSQLGTSTGEFHGGSDKLKLDENGEMTDQTFYDFADWIEQYTDCLND